MRLLNELWSLVLVVDIIIIHRQRQSWATVRHHFDMLWEPHKRAKYTAMVFTFPNHAPTNI